MCSGPLTKAIRLRPVAQRCRTAAAAPFREWAWTVSTGVPFAGPPDHDDRRGRTAELLDVVVGQVERGEDEAVDVAVLEIAHHRELVVTVGAGRVEQQAEPMGAGHLLDRAHHRRVDGVADVRHREGDLARAARAERAGGGVRRVADGLGGLGDAREGVGIRPDAVQHPRGGGDRDVRQARDGRDRRHSVVRFVAVVHRALSTRCCK